MYFSFDTPLLIKGGNYIENITNGELLKYAINNGIINLQDIQARMTMEERQNLLAKHPYKIWENHNNKIWYTYLPDKEKGRVLKKRKNKSDIEELIIQYWKEKEVNPTIDDIFNEWLSDKVKREDITMSTKDRYERQYSQCFSEFGKIKIKDVAEYDIEDFLLKSVNANKLTQKGFSNLRTLIFGIFKYAKKRKYVNFSITEVVNDIEISRKSFRKNIKTDEQEVFMQDELPKVINFLQDNSDLINLGLLLLFKTGLRIGELAGLKWCDIENNIIHVKRTEICYKGKDGNMVFEVRNFPKTQAGIRNVFIPNSCIWIIKKIRSISPFGEFVFEQNGKRIKTYIFRDRLSTVCKRCQIVQKSPHKIRKTYGSILIDNGISKSLIIEQMGHTDIKTTKDHYYYNRKNDSQKLEVINNIVGL